MSRSNDKIELIKLSPLVLYNIATDIQVTDKWKDLAMLIGFTNEQILMLQTNAGDRFPAENVIYHWFSRNPKVDDLARHLCTLSLEKSLHRLKDFASPDIYSQLLEQIQKNRNNFAKSVIKESANVHLESIHNHEEDITFKPTMLQQQLSNVSTNSTADPSTPETGVINLNLHDPSIPRSSLFCNGLTGSADSNNDDTLNQNPTFVLYKRMLKERSHEFYTSEFIEMESCDMSSQGSFSKSFSINVRANQLEVRAFYLPKVLDTTKDKKRLYNIIWFSENYKLHHFPILTGFCFYEDYLFLLYPYKKTESLYNMLHRSHNTENKEISAYDRLNIVKDVGEALAFIHSSIPFSGYHGQIRSHNVLVSNESAILTGFDKFCTEQPDYIKGLETIKKCSINAEDCFRKDKIQYLELLCETWWNEQPYAVNENESESVLINVVVGRKILIPKVPFNNWNNNLNEQVRAFIEQYSCESKQVPSVAEIVRDFSGLLSELCPSLEPPMYSQVCFEDKSDCDVSN